jgi:hypothetical protein
MMVRRWPAVKVTVTPQVVEQAHGVFGQLPEAPIVGQKRLALFWEGHR